jgi:hypothetical protein
MSSGASHATGSSQRSAGVPRSVGANRSLVGRSAKARGGRGFRLAITDAGLERAHGLPRLALGSRGNEIRAARVSSRKNPPLSLAVASLRTGEIRAKRLPFDTPLRRVASAREAHGVSVREENVAALAALLYAAGFEDTGDALLVALDAEQALVALSIADREAILRVLDDPPTGLAELRGVLVADHEGPVRDGLV